VKDSKLEFKSCYEMIAKYRSGESGIEELVVEVDSAIGGDQLMDFLIQFT
jgi:hypothetical protein